MHRILPRLIVPALGLAWVTVTFVTQTARAVPCPLDCIETRCYRTALLNGTTYAYDINGNKKQARVIHTPNGMGGGPVNTADTIDKYVSLSFSTNCVDFPAE